MTALTAVPVLPPKPPVGRIFLAVLQRDVYVTTSELPSFLAQVFIQPLLLLFLLGRILPDLGYTRPGYIDILFPGSIALATFITAVQSIAVPLAADFSWTREIEDRLLAPIPTGLIAVEKILYASLRAVFAAVVTVPAGVLILDYVPWRWSGLPLLAAVVTLGALVGSAIGLVLGVAVPPTRIGLMMTLAFPPMLFTGCSQYSWPALHTLPWFQAVTALNPMTYVSEGARAALVPEIEHIDPGLCLAVLAVSTIALAWIGIGGFTRRAFLA